MVSAKEPINLFFSLRFKKQDQVTKEMYPKADEKEVETLIDQITWDKVCLEVQKTEIYKSTKYRIDSDGDKQGEYYKINVQRNVTKANNKIKTTIAQVFVQKNYKSNEQSEWNEIAEEFKSGLTEAIKYGLKKSCNSVLKNQGQSVETYSLEENDWPDIKKAIEDRKQKQKP